MMELYRDCHFGGGSYISGMFFSFMKLICYHTGDKKAWLPFRGLSVFKAIASGHLRLVCAPKPSHL